MTAKTPEPFPTLKDLPLDAIRTDGGTQPRVRIDPAVVHEYAERMKAGDRFPPVTVYFDGTDHWLSDGFHRLDAAREAGLRTVQAEVWEGTRDDAFWMSLGANQTHGLRRSNEDKVRAVKAALAARPDLSDSAIAEHVGVSHTMVAKYRAEARATCNGCKSTALAGSKTAIRTGRDGRTINTAGIGKPRSGPTREPAEDADAPPDPDDIPMGPVGAIDKTGRPIEGQVAEAFARRQEIQDLMTAVSKVKTAVLKAVEAKDPLFADLNPSRFEAEANSLHHQLRSAMPYAACPYCRAAGCKACHGRGWVGEFVYERAPRELKAS